MAEQTISSEVQSTSRPAHCDASGCEGAAAAALESRALCVRHFISSSQDEIEERGNRLKREPYDRGSTDSFRKFLAECARQAQRLADDKLTVDPQQRARLLDLLLRTSDLTAHLRRSPRQPASVPVWLRREDPGRTWEEETRTLAISRHGAGFECRHFVETGGTLVVARRDNGRRTQARVAYCRFDSQGQRQIGVEFLDRDDFWGLDVNSAQAIASAAFHDSPASAASDSTTLAPGSAAIASTASTAVAEPVHRKDDRNASAGSFADRWIARERGFWRALEINDVRQLKKLLADDFVWIYDRGRRNRRAVIDAARELCPAGALRVDFEAAQIAPGFVRVTFRSSRASLTGSEPARVCFHTSLWLERDSKPQLVLHQITPAA